MLLHSVFTGNHLIKVEVHEVPEWNCDHQSGPSYWCAEFLSFENDLLLDNIICTSLECVQDDHARWHDWNQVEQVEYVARISLNLQELVDQ